MSAIFSSMKSNELLAYTVLATSSVIGAAVMHEIGYSWNSQPASTVDKAHEELEESRTKLSDEIAGFSGCVRHVIQASEQSTSFGLSSSNRLTLLNDICEGEVSELDIKFENAAYTNALTDVRFAEMDLADTVDGSTFDAQERLLTFTGGALLGFMSGAMSVLLGSSLIQLKKNSRDNNEFESIVAHYKAGDSEI